MKLAWIMAFSEFLILILADGHMFCHCTKAQSNFCRCKVSRYGFSYMKIKAYIYSKDSPALYNALV